MSRDLEATLLRIYLQPILLWTALLFLQLPPVLAAERFPFQPPANFTLKPAYIALHHPVTTKQVAAQLYFDQGLTLTYAFNHDAAYWSFLKATESDPKLAMGYWGMAFVLGQNINMDVTQVREKAAYAAIQKALQLAPQALVSEQDYIRALAKRYADDPQPDLPKLARAYSDAMRVLTQKYPDDLDAATLFAESLLDLHPWRQWSATGEPLEGTLEAVDKLEYVLKCNPHHLGANHYYIHAIEASLHPERALMCAERLQTAVPASGHLLHMPSHIYILVGDYQKAALANEAAALVDRSYIREYGVDGIYPIHYLSHNLYFLSRAYSMQGRFAAAKRTADELATLYLPHLEHMPDLEYYLPTSLFVLLRFQHWQEVLQLPEPPMHMPMTHLLWHFGRTLAFIGLQDLAAAAKEQQQFLRAKEELPLPLNYGYNEASKIAQIAAYLLNGKYAEATGHFSAAADWLQKAIAIQDGLSYNEPPDWFFPIREALGGLLLRQKQYAAAEQVFRADLQRHPRNGRALYGLQMALEAQKRSHDAYWVAQAFQEAWQYSNMPLTINDL